jgi:hypothetical protein
MSAHAGNILNDQTVAHVLPPLELRASVQRTVNGLAVLLVYGMVMTVGVLLYLALFPFTRFGAHARRMGLSSGLAHRNL